MADDRSRSASAGDVVHDDDELAEVLAAELERYATGTVPVLPQAEVPPPAPAPVDFARRAAAVERAISRHDRGDAFRRQPTDEVPVERRPSPVRELPTTTEDIPLRRRSGFRPATEAAPVAPLDPLDRVLPTGPVALPEATASLLGEMAETPPRPARHAAPPQPDPQDDPSDPLKATGPLSVPQGLYSDWERSLRSIGRPRLSWEVDDGELVAGAPVDAPTVAMRLPRPPATETVVAEEAAPGPASGAHALPAAPPDAEDESVPRRRRAGRRRADPIEEPAVEPLIDDGDDGLDDAEVIDEVEVAHPHVSAATTGAVELPSVEPRPRTAPVLIERVRTALLQLPVVPIAASGSGGAAIVGRWLGAVAAPVSLLTAAALAGAGAGPAAGAALVLGVLLALPAAARSAVWTIGANDDGAMLERALLGPGRGRVAGTILVLCRLVAAAVVVFAVATLVATWAARTGALGGSASVTGIVTALAVTVLATAIACLPVRAVGVLVLLLGALGAVGTLLLALVLAPGSAAGARPAGVVAAVVAGFAGIGLLLVLCGADVARWRTALPTRRATAWATVVAGVGGAAVVAALLLVAPAGAGDPATVLVAALSDATAAALAAPVGVLLIVASVTLPVLLLSSTGSAAARLVDGGRSARLGTVAAGLLVLAGALGLVGAAQGLGGVVIAAVGLAGVPVAVWTGVVTTARAGSRAVTAAIALAGVVLGWVLCDGLLPGFASPALGVVPAALRGGPAVGLAVAVLAGLLAGAVGRPPAAGPLRDPADTVEG